MSIHRVNKTGNFTTMSNHHLQNKNLSAKAIGIFSVILALPDDWEFSLAGLSTILKDGITSIRSAVSELEAEGYIVRRKIRCENGRFDKTVYDIYEMPLASQKENEVCAKENNSHSDNTENIETVIKSECGNSDSTSDSCKANNNIQANSANLDNAKENCSLPQADFPKTDNPISETLTQLNTNKQNTNIQNISYPIYQSISVDRTDGSDRTLTNNTENNTDLPTVSDYEKFKQIIKDNISYNDFLITKKSYELEAIDEIVDIMTEVVAINNSPMRINGSMVSAEVVKNQFLKIKYDDIEYILSVMADNTAEIRNIRAYLITTIYNAKFTINSYYQAKVNHDLYAAK